MICGWGQGVVLESGWLQYRHSPGGVSRAGDNLVVIQEATAGQVTWKEAEALITPVISDQIPSYSSITLTLDDRHDAVCVEPG